MLMYKCGETVKTKMLSPLDSTRWDFHNFSGTVLTACADLLLESYCNHLKWSFDPQNQSGTSGTELVCSVISGWLKNN